MPTTVLEPAAICVLPLRKSQPRKMVTIYALTRLESILHKASDFGLEPPARGALLHLCNAGRLSFGFALR